MTFGPDTVDTMYRAGREVVDEDAKGTTTVTAVSDDRPRALSAASAVVLLAQKPFRVPITAVASATVVAACTVAVTAADPLLGAKPTIVTAAVLRLRRVASSVISPSISGCLNDAVEYPVSVAVLTT